MRSVVACAAALAAAPLAACSELADGVSLLQVKAQEQPAEDDRFELLCDEMTGCRYHLHTPSTPAPYQLICDDKLGCRYTGVTQAPASNPPALLSVEKQDELELLLHKLSAAMTTPAPKANPFKDLNLNRLMERVKDMKLPDMSNVKLPDLSQLKLPEIPGLPPLPKPDEAQLHQWAKEYKGADQPTARILSPNMTAVKWLLKMVTPTLPPLPKQLFGMMPTLPPMPALNAVAAPAPVLGPVAHFVPDNLMCCVQGPAEYVGEKLAKIKKSPIGGGYLASVLVEGTCASQGYDMGPNKEACFPKANLWLSNKHAVDPTSEVRLMAAHAAQHGFASIGKGMAELCAP
mmetsp:Transcript_104137/g.277068  ORF Transcript_104137/g.277068 Transcript_104137/m.277068 type:complete len:346 (-) Transcript_104137:147-1184(-)|eukprot:CAMPEP_0171175756 /NCGR_PEP_ID=MMETSP0790-20130122/11391_1 /TAXON_ID=2925 /ORGANISM="Alexandrium catenella, Strain OF101" /LENGTH=345 /DNA_ID=CAMNT_0011640639 /DNA_START=75 /DNA_END=1112 /DNA_ORIENTATION=+